MKNFLLLFFLLNSVLNLIDAQTLSESFESGIPSDWTVINNDGDGNQWAQTSAKSHSGSYEASVLYNSSGNDDWLITKQITVGSNDFFSFWAASYSASYLEDFNVKVSKTGTAIADFTITLEEIRNHSATYTKHSYDLVGGGYGISAGNQIYIAIQCVSVDESRLCVDDFLIDAPPTPNCTTPVSPTDNETVVSIAGNLEWNSAEYATDYTLYFGTNGEGTSDPTNIVNGVDQGNVTTYSYSGLSYSTTYYWKVVPKNSTGSASNCPIWEFTTAPEGLVNIGNGTEKNKRVPIEPYYDYSYSQTLYLSSDFGSVGTNKRITKIYYNYSKVTSGNTNADNWVVYLGKTSNSSVSDWTAISSMTKVFDGSTGFGALSTGDGWMEITLDTKFNYNPSTDGNLIIAVDENSAGYTSIDDYFYCDNNTSKNNVSIEYHSTSVNPDPSSPPSGNVISYYPNIRFQFEDIPVNPVFEVTPASKDFGTVNINKNSSSQTFIIKNAGGGTLQISSVSITGTNPAEFTLTDNNSYPVDLASEASITVSVVFSPTTEGTKSANLHIVANDKTDHDAALSGTGHNPTVSSYPYNEPFTDFTVSDNATGYTNDWETSPENTTSAFRWTPDNGGTPSANTGPNADHTSGDAVGKYLFTEANDGSQNDIAYVYSPPFDLSSLTNPAVKFYYYLYGADIGTLNLDISKDNGSTWTNLFSVAGEQQSSGTEQWLAKYLELSAYSGETVSFRFKAVRGSGYRGDIAIDDFYIGERINSSVNSITVTHPFGSGAEVFMGTANYEMLKLDFSVTAGYGDLPLNSINVTPVNTANSDVASNGVKLYRTGENSFTTDNLVATENIASSVLFNNINFNLSDGHTYYWITYDVASDAVPGNILDIKIPQDGINVNRTTFNSTEDNPSNYVEITGLEMTGLSFAVASNQDVDAGTSNAEILQIDFTVEESTTASSDVVHFTSLNAITENTDDADVTNVKLYRTDNETFSTDNLIATTTISKGGKGSVSFSLSENLTQANDYYYWIAYDIASSAKDGDIVDVKIPANGITVDGVTYESTETDLACTRTIKQYNSGGDGTNYGGYYWSNSTSGSNNSNPPTYNWIDPVANGHTQITSWSGSDDDGYYGTVNIGFTFNFFGTDYSDCYIGTNGGLFFGSGSDATCGSLSIPSADDPDNLIAGCLMDLDDGTDGKIYYGTSDGNFVATWFHYHDYGSDAEYITFQIILKPNGNIKIQYNQSESSLAAGTINGDALIGIENGDGSVGIQYRNNGSGGPIFNPTKTSDLAVEFGQNESALPVELVSFTGTVEENSIILNWKTATELNNYGFEVERKTSESESDWAKIGFVEGAGSSNSTKLYSFSDNNVPSGKFYYRLKQIDINGKFQYSEKIEVKLNIPSKFELKQNYPNPFNPTTTIKYSIPNIGSVETQSTESHGNFTSLRIYNILGETVATLVNKKLSPGTYTVKFDASNLPSGIYFYQLKAGDFVAVKKMILMK